MELFLKQHHRQLQNNNDIFNFLTPDLLKVYDIKDRFTNITFNRDLAIKRSDLEFFAIGHPFVNAMLSFIGSYDFGGLCAKRIIRDPTLSCLNGFQFNFIVKKRITQEFGDEYLFIFYSVFVDEANNLNIDACKSATNNKSDNLESLYEPILIEEKFDIARKYLEKIAELWDWDEEVDLINVARVEFIK
jgi:hypothetical protein